MKKDNNVIQAVQDALKLDGDPENIKEYYAGWADQYDQELENAYPGPEIIVKVLMESIETVSANGDRFESGPATLSTPFRPNHGCGVWHGNGWWIFSSSGI